MQVDMHVEFPSAVATAFRALSAKFKLDGLDKALLALCIIQAMVSGKDCDDETLDALAAEGSRVSKLMLGPIAEHYADKGIRL